MQNNGASHWSGSAAARCFLEAGKHLQLFIVVQNLFMTVVFSTLLINTIKGVGGCVSLPLLKLRALRCQTRWSAPFGPDGLPRCLQFKIYCLHLLDPDRTKSAEGLSLPAIGRGDAGVRLLPPSMAGVTSVGNR